MKAIVALLCTLALAPASHAGEPTKPDPIPRGDYAYARQYLTWFIEKALRDEDDIPAMSIALVDDQRIVWSAGFGLADKAKQRRASATTVYRAGGLSAPLTATAVLRLVDRRRVDLEVPIQRYVPRFGIQRRFDGQNVITPRALLTHHSGLPMGLIKGMWSSDPVSLGLYVEQLKTQYMAQRPNTVYSYSPAGYSVLGRLVENVSGDDFAHHMQKTLLAPLGMTKSGFALRSDLAPSLATGYREGRAQPLLAARDTPGLGLYTTVDDYGRFLAVLFADGRFNDENILQPASVAQMLTAQNSAIVFDFDNQIGLGWHINPYLFPTAGKIAWQHGATLLFRSRVLISPEHKLGVIVMANAAEAYHLLEEVGEKAMALMLETKAGLNVDKGDTETERQSGPTNGAPLRQWTGEYSSLAGLIAVQMANDHLQADLLGWRFQLQPVADGWTRPRYNLFGVIPIPIETLNKIRLKYRHIRHRDLLVLKYQGQRHLFATRFNGVPVPNAWMNRLGRYEVADRDALLDILEINDGSLEFDGSYLYFSYRLPHWLPTTLKVPVQPINDTAAIIPGLGTAMGETILAKPESDGDHLIIGGYTLRKVPTAPVNGKSIFR